MHQRIGPLRGDRRPGTRCSGRKRGGSLLLAIRGLFPPGYHAAPMEAPKQFIRKPQFFWLLQAPVFSASFQKTFKNRQKNQLDERAFSGKFGLMWFEVVENGDSQAASFSTSFRIVGFDCSNALPRGRALYIPCY